MNSAKRAKLMDTNERNQTGVDWRLIRNAQKAQLTETPEPLEAMRELARRMKPVVAAMRKANLI